MGCFVSKDQIVTNEVVLAPFIKRPMGTPLHDEYKEIAWGIEGPSKRVTPMWVNRHQVGPKDVKIEMKYCGVCHTDLHFAKNDLGNTIFPCVPGHELVGTVVEAGKEVTKFRVGDNVGIGCMVDSCMDCSNCKSGDEQYCKKGFTWSYNGEKTHGNVGGNPSSHTLGGYTASYVCQQHFVCKIPSNLPLEKAGPLMCAGITMYEPLKYYKATEKKGMTIGIIGIGGLGTMGIKLAKAMGHRVVAISRSKAKKDLALGKGADSYVALSDEASMKSEHGKLDLILNTISSDHQCAVYLPLLATNGILVQMGVVTAPQMIVQLPLIFNRNQVAGSVIGGMASTQEMLDFCALHNIVPDTQEIQAKDLDWAFEQLVQNKDAVRYVIDIKESLKDKGFMPSPV